jgi:hypothetical protein
MIIIASWGLGLITTLFAVLLKLAPSLEDTFTTRSHFVLLFAAVLFLCAMATGEMERAMSPRS